YLHSRRLPEKSESSGSASGEGIEMAAITRPVPARYDPRSPNIATAGVQLPAVKDYEQVDHEIIRTLRPSLGWFIGLGVAVLALLIGISAWMYQIYSGLGVAGYNPPVMWGV